MEQGTREDRSTGLTPKKRVWQYVDEWELTQTRDVVLKAWRQGSGFNAENETFIAERVPLPAEDTEEEDAEDVEAMMVDPVASPKESRLEELVPESPVSLSVTSSTSSTFIPIAPPPTKKTLLKSGPPALGTLTDRPTNVITQRGSRRVR
jgi:kinesin family protein 11